MLNIIFLLQYESSAEKCYYLDTRCSSVDLSRITFIFKAVTGWLVISCHKRCFCKTMDIRLKNKQNTEARKAVLNALTYKTEWQNVNSIKINGVAFVVSSNAAQGHVMVQMPLSNYAVSEYIQRYAYCFCECLQIFDSTVTVCSFHTGHTRVLLCGTHWH